MVTTEITTTKICCKCKEARLIYLFVADMKTADKLNNRCCLCTAKLRNPDISFDEVIARRLRKLERIELKKIGRCRCTICKEIKDLKGGFQNSRHSKATIYCKLCAEQIVKNTVARPDIWIKHRDSKKIYRDSKKIYRDSKKIYRDSKPERKWAKYSIKSHRDRGFEILLTEDELIGFINQQSNCAYCGYKLYIGHNVTLDICTADRIVSLDNIAACCKPCNSSKFTRSGVEYKRFLELHKDLKTRMHQENDKLTKAYYAAFIPFDVLKELALKWQQ